MLSPSDAEAIIEINAPKNLGFLDPKSGRLLSKNELTPLDATSGDTTAAAGQTADSLSPNLKNAIQSVKGRTNRQINGFGEVLNQNIDNLKNAKSSLQDLRGVAKELKKAIKEGDDVRASELRETFGSLRSKQKDLSDKIESDNRSLADQRIQSIRVGNQTRATLKTEEVRFSESSDVDLSSVDSINSFLEESNAELESLSGQLETQRGIRKETKQLNRDLRKELNNLQREGANAIDDAIGSLEQAQSVSNSVAAEIGSQQTLETTLLSNVEGAIAEDLLRF